MTNKQQTSKKEVSKKKPSLIQSDLPSVSLKEALRIATALRDNYNLNSATPLDVGLAIGIAPTSGGFRTLASAALAFGITSGGWNASEIALTDLGKRIVAPTSEGEDDDATQEAFEKPRITKEFLAKYNNGKLPSETVLKNVLNGMGVPFEITDRAHKLLVSGLREQGYIRSMNDAEFVQRPAGGNRNSVVPISESPADEDPNTNDVREEKLEDQTFNEDQQTPTHPITPERPNAIFLGHGKNKQPLEQLTKILDEYHIPHKEAIAEANAGRPIPTKVADTMRECGAAILVFTADEKFYDEQGNELWRPSENVVHELGAASMLYENRIIIFKEEGVTLASNFSSIGYISFEKNKLKDKGIELFRELVSFKIVNITVGG